MKLVIKRSEWYRGNTQDSRLIRSEDGKKCCLGFLGLQCGLPETKLIGRATPTDVYYCTLAVRFDRLEDIGRRESWWPKAMDFLISSRNEQANSYICGKLMRLNDAQIGVYIKDIKNTHFEPRTKKEFVEVYPPVFLHSEQDREQKLAAVFAEAGIEVEYVD